MKDTCLEDTELYDSMTSVSGDEEEYVPDSNPDTDSDSSTDLSPRKRQFLDSLLNPGSDMPNECDTTTPGLDTHSVTSEFSVEEEPCPEFTVEEEPCPELTVEEEPCSSQDTSDSLVVSSHQNKNGKRSYDKRNYCFYCRKPYAKMARHLEHVHENKVEVARAFSFPKKSKERKRLLEYIRNKGNYAHNATVMESGKGQLVPCKRPPKEAQGTDFMHCAYCQGLFTRNVLWRHMRVCRLKPGSVNPKPGKNRVQALCAYTAPVPSHISRQLWKVVSAMNHDPVTEIIKNDHVIIEYGQHLLNKCGMTLKSNQCIREKMRELGRLLDNARKHTRLKKMEDFINPAIMEMVKAVKSTCGYESSTNTFAIPSLATKLGNALVKSASS
ncbi:uncharacterized protein LOC125879526 [Epinephelus fuscoguttatus]|uniref:uncharacterized protein LOC125879526 n=1 Tax=Epinephelus fuscoguttatus TaxID=293821 RepID=UPI0020D0CABE|nr:uncharacterized protein LOC125879526 [Epinephelus fuscoguttatus]